MMNPHVAIVSRPAGGPARPRPVAAPPSRARPDTAALAAEARRLAHRRSVAEGVARRTRANTRGLGADAWAEIARRSTLRAARLGPDFHRAIETLWAAGGFDEALAIYREHKTDRARRAGQA